MNYTQQLEYTIAQLVLSARHGRKMTKEDLDFAFEIVARFKKQEKRIPALLKPKR